MSSEWRPLARSLLRAANGVGASAAEDLWAWGSSVAAPVWRTSPRAWTTSDGDRVLWVAPHPDDEAMGGAGTLLRHTAHGDRIWLATVTDGARSRAFGLEREEMAALREQESKTAAARLGVGVERRWAGLPEGDWTDDAARRFLTEVLTESRPTTIYAPSSIDFHPEHQRVARALASVLEATQSSAEVLIYSVQVPLTPILVNRIHDVSDLEDPIHGVLTAFSSQRESVQRTYRLRRYAARFYGARSQVESFCAMSAQAYVELHRRRQVSFRALRIRAWSDPGALAWGVGERWAWRQTRGAV